MEFIIGLKEWIVIIIGAVIGYILPYLFKFIPYILCFAFRKELLEGIWHAYHFSRMHGGKTLFRYERWKIKRDVLNRLVITTKDPKNPDLKYKGIISVEKNYLLILLKGVKHEEEVQMRFSNIIPTGQDIAYGLAMGVDFDNKPQCLVRIMSRKELTEEEAKEVLLSKTIIREPGIIGISE